MKITTQNKQVAFMLTILALLLAVFVSLFIFTIENRKRITESNQQYFIDDTAYTASIVDAAISDGYGNIKILSNLVSDSLTSNEFDIKNMQDLINDSVFDFMEFADADGVDHNITGGVSDAKDRKYYLDAKNGHTGMELIYVSRATHETLLMFYSPIYYNEEFVGSLVGTYQASNKITELLKTNYFGKEATVYLTTNEGRIIACTDGYDPNKEMYVSEIADGDKSALSKINLSLHTGETVTFSIGENKTGACMQKLENSGWYVIEVFPKEVTDTMVHEANSLAYFLIGAIVAIYIIILFALTKFYKNQQNQVEEAKVKAEIANQAKTTFLFNMSHDIRTPMNAILGYTDIAINHIDDKERVDDSLKKISSSGKHLLSLINDILEMSRIEAGKMELSIVPMDLRDSFNDIELMSKSLAESKNINFIATLGKIKNPFVFSDILHGNEVVINLISNAIKYTNEGGTVNYILEQISTVEDDIAWYRITVKDNGIGMSEEFQKHLFENFSREQSSTVSKQEGAGLGLAIVKKIVDLSNGTIKVESKQNEGSTFVVEVPLKVMDEQTKTLFLASKYKVSSKESNISLKGKRVLLVEDNELNREISSEILNDGGFVVDTAEDGTIAVEKVTNNGTDYYDFILMDIQMPIMDGYTATAKIRELPGGLNIPIIALSANAFKEDIDKSIKLGMDAHVAKPIDEEKLINTMKSLL